MLSDFEASITFFFFLQGLQASPVRPTGKTDWKDDS